MSKVHGLQALRPEETVNGLLLAKSTMIRDNAIDEVVGLGPM